MHEREQGALQVPKDFQRITGAHEILASLALAEALNLLMMVLLGTWVTPIAWWGLKFVGRWFHGSILFDIGFLLFVVCLARGLTRQHQLRKIFDKNKTAADAWDSPGVFMLLTVFLIIVLRLLPWGWMDIPVPLIPTYPLEPIPWPPIHPFLPGAWITVVLLLLVHLRIFHLTRKDKKGLAYSRAHPGGNRTRLIDQAYGFYERGLARFAPPPVHLNVPATFLYFEANELPERLERAIFWVDAESLVISGALLGPDEEQAEMLLPLLARQLYDKNSLTLTVERVLKWIYLAEKRWYTQLLLCFTLLIAYFAQERWKKLERDRVEDRDRFAYWCGQAKRLHKLLRQQKELLTAQKIPDNAIPPLHERIDHLEALMKQEARQVDKLKGSLPPAPPTA